MLEQLFGSSTRVRLLRLFLYDPERPFFVRELTRRIGAQINAVRNELDNLLTMGLLEVVEAPLAIEGLEETPMEKAVGKRKKFYRLNADCLLYPELRSLFGKSRAMLEKDFVGRLAKCGRISYMAMTGHFVGEEGTTTDLLVVGRVQKDRFLPLLRSFEREIGREINYTVMSPQEFKYRRDVTDRFLYSILDGKKIVVVDSALEAAMVA